MKMDKQEIFDFLKENLSLSQTEEVYNEYFETTIWLRIRNPETGEWELIDKIVTTEERP